jgi:mannosyltransferase OCH1-like enzyme
MTERDTPVAQPLPLIQYWDSGNPPDDVAALMRSWADDPSISWRMFDRDMALDYLKRTFRGRVRKAFLKCGVPAMQADFFRYALLYAEGGAYVDADIANLGGFATLCADSGRGLLMDRRGKIANDVLYVAAAGDALFGAALGQAIANIEAEVSQNVWQVTGPGIMTGLHRRADAAALFEGFRILPVADVGTSVKFHWTLDYKQGENDWRQVQSKPQRNIFQ